VPSDRMLTRRLYSLLSTGPIENRLDRRINQVDWPNQLVRESSSSCSASKHRARADPRWPLHEHLSNFDGRRPDLFFEGCDALPGQLRTRRRSYALFDITADQMKPRRAITKGLKLAIWLAMRPPINRARTVTDGLPVIAIPVETCGGIEFTEIGPAFALLSAISADRTLRDKIEDLRRGSEPLALAAEIRAVLGVGSPWGSTHGRLKLAWARARLPGTANCEATAASVPRRRTSVR
jgi:hypothetical protein